MLGFEHDHFSRIIESQKQRVAQMKETAAFIDYKKLDTIIIGICGGDGIGPIITEQARRVLEYLLKDETSCGKILFSDITGLTIENRAACKKAIPDEVLAQLKACNVILKGPTTTPRAGDPWPNIESANVAMRRELDLFANVRPVFVPDKKIDWVFFRENTEGSYAVGSLGLEINEDIAIDFTITTTQGSERIIRLAFEHAFRTGRSRVTAVTKANVIKTTDGKFLKIAKTIASQYPTITFDDWYIDIMTAKLVDEKRRTEFQVFVLPNLYGDILTDEAAEFQGGVGTAGSANIGTRWAMFEAIHGSAPRMVTEGRGNYADPCSMLRASVMLLEHIGFERKAEQLAKALNRCMFEEKRIKITGRDDGATCAEFADYVLEALGDSSTFVSGE